MFSFRYKLNFFFLEKDFKGVCDHCCKSQSLIPQPIHYIVSESFDKSKLSYFEKIPKQNLCFLCLCNFLKYLSKLKQDREVYRKCRFDMNLQQIRKNYPCHFSGNLTHTKGN